MSSPQDLKSQSVLSFNGNGYVDLGIQAHHAVPCALTLEAWIKPRAQRQWVGIISKIFDTGGTESGYGMLLDGSSGVYFGIKWPDSGIGYFNSGANSVRLDTWQHVAMTYDGQHVRIYVDGKLVFEQARAAAAIHYNPPHYLRIGEYRDNNESYGFVGEIGEVRLWSVCRTAEELAEHRARRLGGDEAGLVGYWPLDEGEGTTANDRSSHATAGTIHGATWTREPLPVTAASPAAVAITTINYDGAVKRTEADEYVEITNTGGEAADLSGWTLGADDVDQSFRFPAGTTLAGGQSIRVYTDQVDAATGGFSFASKRAIWNNAGDVGRLFDADGTLISAWGYAAKAPAGGDGPLPQPEA